MEHGDLVRTLRHGHKGTITRIYKTFADTTEGASWFAIQKREGNATEEDRFGPWVRIKVTSGGGVLVPLRDVEPQS